jgi:hypothetical protein
MDDAFIDRLAEKLADSDSAMKRLQGPDRASLSTEDAMAAVIVIAEAASMMEDLADRCLQLNYENAKREAMQVRTVH